MPVNYIAMPINYLEVVTNLPPLNHEVCLALFQTLSPSTSLMDNLGPRSWGQFAKDGFDLAQK